MFLRLGGEGGSSAIKSEEGGCGQEIKQDADAQATQHLYFEWRVG